MCGQIGLFNFRNLPEPNHTPVQNSRFYGVFGHFRRWAAQIHFRNLPESVASGVTLSSAFRKNPEIDNAKNPVKIVLSIPIPEESGNATAPTDNVPSANALNAPLRTEPCALPSGTLAMGALSPTTPTTTMMTTATTTAT